MKKFDANIPVYLQVIDIFYMWVISGKLSPGDQIPPVRKLAIEWEVNPNTVQKALQKLEEDGFTEAHVGRGRYVTEDLQKLETMKNQIIEKDIEHFVNRMHEYQINNEDIIMMLTQYLQRKEK